MDPVGPERPTTLPAGPHPTVGRATISMPRWPGPVLAVVGGLLAVGALAVASLALDGRLSIGDPAALVWAALVGGVLFAAGFLYIALRQLRVRRFLAPERYRGPAVLILLVLVFVVASVITAPFGTDAAVLLGGQGEPSLLGAAVILLSTQVALLLVSWLFVFRPKALEALPSPAGRDPMGAVRSGVGWGLLAWLVATVALSVVTILLDRVGFDVQPQAAQQAIATIDPWLVVLAIVILAPLAEEVFFRGVVFNAWLREGGRRWAFIGSSALFAIIHLSVVAFIPIFLLGLALAWIYERTGNLLAPIAMHTTVNAISVALALLVRFDVVRLPV